MWIRTRLLAAFLLLVTASACLEESGLRAGTQPQVVVLHGLGRTATSMLLLAERLEDAGFEVHNFDYPSTEEPVEQLVDRLRSQVDRCCTAPGLPLHFVTHSLGGILVRVYLANSRPANLGRVVMLSPPNHGSEIVDTFGDNPLFDWALGPAGQQLGTRQESLPNRLGPADFELGIITGSASLNPLTSWLVSGQDDGKVSVESARLHGMTDFLVVPRTHTFIMNSTEVTSAVIRFLRSGTFSNPEGGEGPQRGA